VLLRGILQTRFSFIVPDGVEVVEIEELSARRFNVVRGMGSDGKLYLSTEIFSQNYDGEIVQVVPLRSTVYGLMKDGRVFMVGRETNGAMVESCLSEHGGLRFTFMVSAAISTEMPRLLLIGTDGRLYALGGGSRCVVLPRRQPPDGVDLVAVGKDTQGRFIAEDRDGRYYEWLRSKRRYRLLDSSPTFDGVTSSLLHHGIPGVLWVPK